MISEEDQQRQQAMVDEGQREEFVLILGGTNFMGKALLDELSLLPYQVCCINRGKEYWNGEAKKDHPKVHWFCADRRDHQDYTKSISFASRHLGISATHKWRAVIDFCAFSWRDLQSSIKPLQNLAEQYIFISSDSVYNNFTFKAQQPLSESQFDLQKEYKRIKQGNRKGLDDYGYNKMKCELYLRRKCTIPFVCLRLPDVIGAYDNTNRLWATMKWMQWSDQNPMYITPEDEFTMLSFVDSQSVAGQLMKMIKNGSKMLKDNAYNLGFEKGCTLVDFLKVMEKVTGYEMNLKMTQNGGSSMFYPSVECGAITSAKAIEEIGWRPATMEKALERACQFFLEKGWKYQVEQREMEKEFKKKVLKEKGKSK